MNGGADFLVTASPRQVEAWSVRRLGFEPRGSMLELRTELRSALAQLVPADGWLRCVYSSTVPDFCDAENVLLYNVGMSSFARLMGLGVLFERALDVPPCPTALAGVPLHHHFYATGDATMFRHWQVDDVVVRWEGATPPRPLKAADWWSATCAAMRDTVLTGLSAQPFGIHLRLATARRPLLSSLLKPMLDGIISAFHCDPSPEPEALARLAHHLQIGEQGTRAHLTRPAAPLGSRALVRPFRDGLQWNPADDLCVACLVEVEEVLAAATGSWARPRRPAC